MKQGMLALILFFLGSVAAAQQPDALDSVQEQLELAQTPQAKVDLLNNLAYDYTQLSLSTAEVLANEALGEATAINYEKGIGNSYNVLGIAYSIRGDYTSGLDFFYKALKIREGQNDFASASKTLTNIARVFHYLKDFDRAREYTDRALELYGKTNDSIGLARTYIAVGDVYLDMKDNANALITLEKSRQIFARAGLKNMEGYSLVKIASAFESEKKYQEALAACFKAKELINPQTDLFTTIDLYQSIGSVYAAMGKRDDAYHYLRQAMSMSDEGKSSHGRISSRLKLASLFKQFKEYDSALQYMDAYARLNAEAFDTEKARQLATLEKIYQQEKKDRQLELNNEKIRYQTNVILVISLLLVVVALLGLFIYRNYRQKKKTAVALERLNREIYEKHEEILAQAEELSQANDEIRRINESLEAEVMLRSQKIEQQNKKLIDYAYFNAHNVRGPLARILGLTYLMEREGTPAVIKEYGGYITLAAEELDRVIKDINSRLE
jgi:tetratricopeptide (TPR) repeat protein